MRPPPLVHPPFVRGAIDSKVQRRPRTATASRVPPTHHGSTHYGSTHYGSTYYGSSYYGSTYYGRDRSMDRSLTDDEINALQNTMRERAADELAVELR